MPSRGVTLIELLVVLALISIFAVFAVPTYRNLITRNRMATEMNAFVGHLQLARSEAIKRGTFVTMCPSTNGTACLVTTKNWTSGWIVFTDPNNNDTVGTLLRVHTALQGNDTLGSNVAGAITFNRNGFSTNGQTIALGNSATPFAKPPCAVISFVGRVRTGTLLNGSCQ